MIIGLIAHYPVQSAIIGLIGIFIIGAGIGFIVAWAALKRQASLTVHFDMRTALRHANTLRDAVMRENQGLRRNINANKAKIAELTIHLGNAISALN